MKIAVLISGGGTNLQALIDACAEPNYPAEIVLVISNKADAYGLTRAKNAAIPCKVINHKDFPSREEFDKSMDAEIRSSGAEFVCMAGFMRLLSEWFIDEWHNKLINIHPSLLPSFKGIHAQKQALDAGVKITGCTVHFARKEMDAGPIIMQAAVPVMEDDTIESLTARVLNEEHRCYTESLRLICENKVRINGEIAEILP